MTAPNGAMLRFGVPISMGDFAEFLPGFMESREVFGLPFDGPGFDSTGSIRERFARDLIPQLANIRSRSLQRDASANLGADWRIFASVPL